MKTLDLFGKTLFGKPGRKHAPGQVADMLQRSFLDRASLRAHFVQAVVQSVSSD
jgi:hypothetical protein